MKWRDNMAVKMGIKFFDENILKDGFPEGFTVLVAGEPGAGKTILGSTFLYNGMEQFGENESRCTTSA
ncbi:hypothetical protein, conserved (N-terminus) [Thermococcus kodakarensis KOD1]|uniref:KaiC-like domain-containing protein n=1 Tax=Thermococcus kodakarensis (strain ATCC BAA-918 / JCM 12380 / KOD1) TaxID=69014 RepID=Q5JHY0_THEKO|nr:ATPase domain-containing protein [Thermococcus kodakarensis]WCN28837.1 ATPase domain-containing protein [Thermococcus kodakarensis]WCN31138.1 ATPase domain-containing protein [Thermococcus kodakarensis]BAD85019.1 hypothetical protein, conserved (N-terminus) [Thermococcus kodakarensis KOD1]